MIFQKIFNSSLFDNLTNTQRWSGWRMNSKENVIEHSFYVVWFSRLISEELQLTTAEKLVILDYAMFHDFDEIFTGDIRHGVKHGNEFSKEINKILKEIVKSKTNETFSAHRRGENLMRSNILGNQTRNTKDIVKIADWLSMAYTLEREKSLGNANLDRVLLYCYFNLEKKIDSLIKYTKRYGTSHNKANIFFLTELRSWARKKETSYTNLMRTTGQSMDLSKTT